MSEITDALNMLQNESFMKGSAILTSRQGILSKPVALFADRFFAAQVPLLG